MDADPNEATAAAQPSRVLIADSDPDALRQANRALESAGFDVAAAGDAARALTLLDRQRFDLLVLEAAMFGADGLAACTAIRGRARTPVIVSSASAAEADVVRALSLGADDYVTKPLQERTLLARIRAILRRSAMNDASALAVDDVVLDVASQRLKSGTAHLLLTRLETVLLRALLGSTGRAVSGERLALEAWGKAEHEQRHALKQVVYRLRRKLEANGRASRAASRRRAAPVTAGARAKPADPCAAAPRRASGLARAAPAPPCAPSAATGRRGRARASSPQDRARRMRARRCRDEAERERVGDQEAALDETALEAAATSASRSRGPCS